MNLSRLAGIILIVLGLAVGAVAVAWLLSNEDLETPARVLGLGLALVVLVAPLLGVGIYLAAFGGQQARQQQEATQQRRLLNIVQSRGQVDLNELAIEMQMPRQRLKDMLYTLVGLGVFSGYINWEKGVLYSADAARLRDLTQCPNCGGEITLSGQGVAQCRFCGTEFFLS